MGIVQGTIFDKVIKFCKNLIPSRTPPPSPSVKKISSENYSTYSPEKQKKITDLCEKLFQQTELIAAGKIQFLGLGKVKKKLGKMWPGLQPIVYAEVEASINKYLMPGDLFIRYKDDTYVVIFAKASAEEARIKLTLIAEEIKRRLFDHEEESLRDMDLQQVVSILHTNDLKPQNKNEDLLDVTFKNIEKKENLYSASSPAAPPKEIKIPETFEVETDNKAQNTPATTSQPKDTATKYTYIPFWDVQKNLITTYLCLSQSKSAIEDPFDSYNVHFMGATPKIKAKQDLDLLNIVATELQELVGGNQKSLIACPVHYETLTREETYKQYVFACQKIPNENKKFLILVLMDIPEEIHIPNVRKFSIPLKNHCHSFFAQVRPGINSDYGPFKKCGFDALGIRLKNSNKSEKGRIEILENFPQMASRSGIDQIFSLDVTSLSLTTTAVCSGFTLLAGKAIHEKVNRPDKVHRFLHQDLFSKML